MTAPHCVTSRDHIAPRDHHGRAHDPPAKPPNPTLPLTVRQLSGKKATFEREGPEEGKPTKRRALVAPCPGTTSTYRGASLIITPPPPQDRPRTLGMVVL